MIYSRTQPGPRESQLYNVAIRETIFLLLPPEENQLLHCLLLWYLMENAC